MLTGSVHRHRPNMQKHNGRKADITTSPMLKVRDAERTCIYDAVSRNTECESVSKSLGSGLYKA